MSEKEFSWIRRDMDCDLEAGYFLENFMNSSGRFADYLERREKHNLDIIRKVKEIGASRELIDEMRLEASQNANTILVLIDELRLAYPEYLFYPKEMVEQLRQLVEIVAFVGGPMVRGLLQDLYHGCLPDAGGTDQKNEEGMT